MSLPKLVRDKIPDIIKDSGRNSCSYIACHKELNGFLVDKMKEELAEFAESPCLDEAADMYEVFIAILKNWKMELVDVERTAEIKRKIRGGFERGIILEKVL